MGNARTATPKDMIPFLAPALADDPQHMVDSMHPPLETWVRTDLPSRLLAHAEGRDTGLAAGPTSPIPTPWGPLSLGGLRHRHDARTQGAAATSPRPLQEAKGRSYNFTRCLLAPAVSLQENNWKAGWTRELVIRDKILFRQCICF